METNENEVQQDSSEKNIHIKCPYIFCPDDVPTKIVGLGWRALFTFFGWIVLGMGVKSGNGFFVSIFLFAAPLAMDYLKFKPKTNFRKCIKYIGLALSIIWVLIGAIGLFGALEILEINNVLILCISGNFIVLKCQLFPIYIIWGAILINVLLSVVDWISYESNIEKLNIEEHYGKSQHA